MKKSTREQVKLKRKVGLSPDAQVQTGDGEDEHAVHRSMTSGKGRLLSPFRDEHATIPPNVEHIDDVQAHCDDGAWRARQGGYCGPQPEMSSMTEWGGQYAFGGPGRRQWSPTLYGGGGDYQTWGPQYGNRRGQYDGRVDVRHHTESNAYYSRCGAMHNGRAGHYDGRQGPYGDGQLEDRRYDSCHWRRAHGYIPGYPPEQSEQVPMTSMHLSSPPPSSSTQVQETKELEVQANDVGMRLRRPLQLDGSGVPTGKMASLFYTDIVSFSKEMNPSEGWDGQTAEAKQRIVARLMEEYEIQGEASQLSAKYLKKVVGSALIHTRFYLNQLIDKGVAQPADVRDEFWKALKDKRQSKESKEKSEKMASIAKGRVSKQSNKKALEQAAIVRLTMQLEREPNNAEIEEAVQKDMLTLQQKDAEKRRQKMAPHATTAVLQSPQELEKRVELLEAFMSKWTSKLEVWNVVLSEGHDRECQEDRNADKDAHDGRDHLRVALTAHEESEEEDIVHSVDEALDTDDSKDIARFQIESEDGEGEAVGQQTMSDPLHVVTVVEPNFATRPPSTTFYGSSALAGSHGPPEASIAGLDFGKWSEVLAAGNASKSSNTEKKIKAVRSSARTAKKAVKAVEEAQAAALQSRLAKRAKVKSNSENNPVHVDEDSAEDIVKQPPSTAKSAAAARPRIVNSQRKKESTTGKMKKVSGTKEMTKQYVRDVVNIL